VPAHQRLQIGSLLDELMSDYRVRGLKSLGSVVSHLKPVRAHFGTWRAVALKPKDFRGAGSRYKARYFRQEPKDTGHVWVTTPELPWVDVEGVDPNEALRQAASFLADRLRRK
jgi:hypothetical protein